MGLESIQLIYIYSAVEHVPIEPWTCTDLAGHPHNLSTLSKVHCEICVACGLTQLL